MFSRFSLVARPAPISAARVAGLRWLSAQASTASATEPAPVRKTLKPLDSRKTYLVDMYTHLIKTSPVILVLHHNNLLKADNNNLRGQIKKAGGTLTVTRSNLFKVAFRGKDHADPASPAAKAQYGRRDQTTPFNTLFSGPTAVITFPELDPKKVSSVLKIVDKSNNNLTLLGSFIDNQVLTLDGVNKFKTLPTLPEIRSQLVGVLSILGGAGLVQTLEASSKVLYLTMDERRKQLDPTEQTEEKTE